MARACMKYTFLFMAVLVLVVGTGCGAQHRAPLVPPPGMLFTQYKAPLDIDYGQAEQINTPVTQLRAGRSDTQYILVPFLWVDVAWGDASVDRAVRNGGISRVHHADYEYMSILGIYQTFTTVAYGE